MAGGPLEVELKIVLAEAADYASVRAALDRAAAPTEVAQTNYYLDTVDRALWRQKAMARLRAADGKVVFTLKTKPQLHGGVIAVGEREAELPAALARAWLTQPPARSDAGFDVHRWLRDPAILPQPLPPGAQLLVLGAMANRRRSYALSAGLFGAPAAPLTVELDHVQYGGDPSEAERFEIEIESPDAAALLPHVEQWLDDLQVQFCRATETKYQQFLRLRGFG